MWQEIDRLRNRIQQLEDQVARQLAIVENNPQLRMGDITASSELDGERVYTITERNVDAQTDHVYQEVYAIGEDAGPPVGSTVMFYIDNHGKRYVLPDGGRLILVQDLGGSQGRHVEKNSAGAVSVPSGSETLSLVASDPNSVFHGSAPNYKSGRIYFGMKLQDAGGTKYYLVFIEGHGDASTLFSDTVNISGASTITASISVDAQGNVLGLTLS